MRADLILIVASGKGASPTKRVFRSLPSTSPTMNPLTRNLLRFPRLLSARRFLTTSAAPELRKRNVVFSGIQPTGIPHVRATFIFSCIQQSLTNAARKLPWSVSKLVEIAARSTTRGPTYFLHRRMARVDPSTRPKSSSAVAKGHACGAASRRFRPKTMHHISSRRGD